MDTYLIVVSMGLWVGTAGAQQVEAPPPEAHAQVEAIKQSGHEIEVSDAEIERAIAPRQGGLTPWEEVRKKAPGRPTKLERTGLAGATLEGVIDSAPQGYGQYTRIYRLGKEVVELEELDYIAMGNPPQGVNPELANVTVAGSPAVLLVKKSPRHRLSELTWFTGEKLYRLRTTLPRGPLLKLAEEITAAGAE
jgi:hypothetical protein